MVCRIARSGCTDPAHGDFTIGCDFSQQGALVTLGFGRRIGMTATLEFQQASRHAGRHYLDFMEALLELFRFRGQVGVLSCPDMKLTTAPVLCDKRRSGFPKSIIYGVGKILGAVVVSQTLSNAREGIENVEPTSVVAVRGQRGL
jgi:hypothetical protein